MRGRGAWFKRIIDEWFGDIIIFQTYKALSSSKLSRMVTALCMHAEMSTLLGKTLLIQQVLYAKVFLFFFGRRIWWVENITSNNKYLVNCIQNYKYSYTIDANEYISVQFGLRQRKRIGLEILITSNLLYW